ncbi:MAG TPA: GIY-YIG nuclease family protein [Tardiphaga sp.]
MGNPMSGENRKAAIAAYKERKVVAGIYLVRCTATGQAWVGQWPNVTNIQNRIWFTLRQGSHPNPDLQAAWQHNGAAHFQFEILERLDAEETTYVRDALLKERAAHWRSSLDAKSI